MRSNNTGKNEKPVAMAYYHHHQQQHHHQHQRSLLHADSNTTSSGSGSSSSIISLFRRPTTTTTTRSFYSQPHQHQQQQRGILLLSWQHFTDKLKSIVLSLSSFSSSSSSVLAWSFLVIIGLLLVSLYSARNHHHHAANTGDANDPIATLFRHPMTTRTKTTTALRVFGPQSHDKMTMAQQNIAMVNNNDNNDNESSNIIFSFSTTAQQREFLVQHGHFCQSSFQMHHGARRHGQEEETQEDVNIVLATFDAYVNLHDNEHDHDNNDAMHLATELWKYCVLYTGAAHVYWNAQDAHALMEWNSNNNNNNNLLASLRRRRQQQQDGSTEKEEDEKEDTVHTGGGMALLVVHHEETTTNYNQYMDYENDNDDDSNMSSSSSSWPWRIHHALLYIHQAKSFVCAEMMHWLVDRGPLYVTAKKTTSTNRFFLPDVVSLSEYLGLLIHNDKNNNNQYWSLWSTQCRLAPVETAPNTHDKIRAGQQQQQWGRQQRTMYSVHRHLTPRCPNHQFCCQVWNTESSSHVPSFLIRHPLAFSSTSHDKSSIATSGPPHPQERKHYMATVRLLSHVNNNNNSIVPRTFADNPLLASSSPTFFDIMLENSCLPNTHDCFRCLKGTTTTSTTSMTTTTSINSGSRSGSSTRSERSGAATATTMSGGSCQECASVCHCYCRALCKVRPPPKPQPPQVWAVTKPKQRPSAVAASSYSSLPSSRLIPRIIHQTWFEPVNATRYPRQSRLVQSFVESGWEYHFYTDETAAEFISTHFPPPVRKAYDALVPGAFKADLFRYCVLLIHGGLYADMDVLLTSNLDEILIPNVGFMTARDEPGQQVGHGSCLWNGFIAAAPGHPFLAQTVETVVNNIRNRFTSVDYDDMLCPNPVLSVSHSFDVLFTTGPCILGASINRVLKRHAQTGFETGDLDIFGNTPGSGTSAAVEFMINSDDDIDAFDNEEALVVEGQVVDPRLLVPGRSILLQQNKKDMGAHRFTWLERNLIVASTDLPESSDDHSSSISSNDDDSDGDATATAAAAAADDNKLGNGSKKKKKKHLHYSTTHENAGVYGLNRLYTNSERANQDIKIILLG